MPHSPPVNHGLALVRVDGADIRKKIRKAYEKALRDLENSRRLLDRFHQTDQPQFTRWLNSNFGALLTELWEMNQKLAADDAIVILVQNKVGGVGLKAEIQSGAALGTDMEHDVQLGPGAGAVLEGGDEIDLGVAGVAGHRQGKGSAQRRSLITTSRMMRKMPR